MGYESEEGGCHGTLEFGERKRIRHLCHSFFYPSWMDGSITLGCMMDPLSNSQFTFEMFYILSSFIQLYHIVAISLNNYYTNKLFV